MYICLDTESDELNENDEKPKKEGCGLLAPLPLSDALIKFLGDGESSFSRADVVKRLWEYIEQNDLQVCYFLSELVVILLTASFTLFSFHELRILLTRGESYAMRS